MTISKISDDIYYSKFFMSIHLCYNREKMRCVFCKGMTKPFHSNCPFEYWTVMPSEMFKGVSFLQILTCMRDPQWSPGLLRACRRSHSPPLWSSRLGICQRGISWPWCWSGLWHSPSLCALAECTSSPGRHTHRSESSSRALPPHPARSRRENSRSCLGSSWQTAPSFRTSTSDAPRRRVIRSESLAWSLS